MESDIFIYKDQKKLRCGYTTGSCSAGAAKAAAWMLLSGQELTRISLQTPMGIVLDLALEGSDRTEGTVSCGIRKDAGDDVDVTDGIVIWAKVSKIREPGIQITGGDGIGKVTRQGLDQPPGSYAINEVPRRMIRDAVESVMEDTGYEGGFLVVISAPGGEELAARTFNPTLGITGGISILGTSGIVEPMSEKALIDTIRLEMEMHAREGREYCIITPGNYGMHFIGNVLSLDLAHTIKCSNFIGDTIDMAGAYQWKGMLLVGHLGKLVKLGIGIMNTHSRYGDGRMETISACALQAGADRVLLQAVMGCATTDEAVRLLKEAGLFEVVMDILLERIALSLKRRAPEEMEMGAVIFSNRYGLLGETDNAQELIAHLRKEMT